MRWGNIIVDDIIKNGESISYIAAHYIPNGDFKKTEKKINWVAKTAEVVDVTLVEFDYLISKAKLEEGDDFKDFLTSKDHPTKVYLL